MAEHALTTQPMACQLPLWVATQATSGGPMNCPIEEHCCVMPTVADTVSGAGASRTARLNRVLGTRPPTMENSSTAA